MPIDVVKTSQYINEDYFGVSPKDLQVALYPGAPFDSNNYYTKTSVNTWRNGVSSTEMGYLDGVTSDVQTQFNNRYLKTEVDTWRNGVTQTEMGYLHGVTSDVQTQLDDKADIIGAPSNNELAVWTDGFSIEGEPQLIFNGSEFKIYSSESAKSDWALIMDIDDADEMSMYVYDEGESAYKLLTLGINTGGGIIINPTAEIKLHYNSNQKLEILNTGIEVTGEAVHTDFTTGFQGTNWKIWNNGDAEFRNILISGALSAYSMIINRLRYQDGGMIIGPGGGEIAEVVDDTEGTEILLLQDPEGNGVVPFTEGMIVLVQDFDLDRTTVIKKIVREVESLNSDGSITLTATDGWVPGDDSAGDDTGVFGEGDTIVAVGDTSSNAYDSSIYMSSVDSGNPFIRILDGVDSYDKWSLGTKTAVKVQIGNLAALANYDIIPADPGYGLYSDNAFLKGKIVAEEGTIGGFTITEDTLYSGAEYKTDDWNDNSAGGITLVDDGSIHTPNFYVNSDGTIGLREVESVLFKSESSKGIKIKGYSIYENDIDADAGLGYIYINMVGYEGGTTRYRDTVLGNGQGGAVLRAGGEDPGEDKFCYITGQFAVNTTDLVVDVTNSRVGINTDEPNYVLDVRGDVSGGLVQFFNNGNSSSRYGIVIQCGEDTVDASYNYPIVFKDGNNTIVAYLQYNSSGIAFNWSSDIRLKENIKDVILGGLNIVDKLQYHSFNWRKETGRGKSRVNGWIADEVEKLYPEMVSINPETKYKMINENKLIPVMMEAIKELHKKVKKLELKIK